MMGYKVGYEHPYDNYTLPKRLVIELIIPEGARTNLHRKNIVNRRTATYRTNKAYVKRIFNPVNNEDHYTAESMFSLSHTNQMFLYIKDGMYEEKYDTNPEAESSHGIHFFTDLEVAVHYALDRKDNGVLETYYPDGALKTKTIFRDRKSVSFQDFYRDGTLRGGTKN